MFTAELEAILLRPEHPSSHNFLVASEYLTYITQILKYSTHPLIHRIHISLITPSHTVSKVSFV